MDNAVCPYLEYKGFLFGVRAEFCFHSFGDMAAKEAMVQLGKAYYRECDPAPKLSVRGNDGRMLKNEAGV